MTTPQFPRVEVAPARAPDRWTAHVHLAEGQRVALHSTRAPATEAQRQLEAVDTHCPSVVVLIGAGLGFVTEAARDRWPGARLVIFEPSPELAHHARARTPELYATDRVRLLSGPDYASDQPLWQLLDQGKGPEPAVIVHPVIARTAPEAAAVAEASARRAIHAAQMNARARQDNAGRYLLNTLRNLAVTVCGFDVTALYGRLAGVPVIIVAAGPSLDRQLPALRTLAGRALIIAADTAWRPLAAAGIDPHVVVAVDPTEINGEHLLKVPSRSQPWLIAEPSIDPRVSAAFGYRAGAFRVANHHPWPWVGTLGISPPVVRVWGSVITACADLALSFGGDPIVFAGADLAFTGGQPYCRGTTFERDWARTVAFGWSLRETWDRVLASRPAVMAPGLDGQETRTAPYLIEFRDWLVERAAEHPERRFVNTTGAGILAGPRIEQCDLVSMIGGFPNPSLPIHDMLRTVWAPPAPASSRRALRDALQDLRRETAVTPGDEVGPLGTPLADWLEFGGSRLTSSDVYAALHHAVATLDHVSSVSAAPLEVSPSPVAPASIDVDATSLHMHEADRVMRMRSWLEGDAADAVDASHGAGASDAGDVVTSASTRSDVRRALDRILSVESPLATGLARDLGEGIEGERVPLSYRFEWAPGVMPLVASLEETLLDRRAADPARSLAARDQRSLFWNRSDSPTFGAYEDLPSAGAAKFTTPADLDAAARGSIVATTLSLLPESEVGAPRVQRLCRAVVRGLLAPGHQRTPRTPHRLRWRDWPVDVPLRLDALMRALTGTLARFTEVPSRPALCGGDWPLSVEPATASSGVHDETHPDRIDPRVMFMRPGTIHIEPGVLTDRGVAGGWVCETIDERHASVAPTLGRQSILVDATGHTSTGAAWPDDINREVPWGPHGGAIAWNTGRSEAFHRGRRDGEATRFALPFAPVEMTTNADVTCWVDASCGLWEWAPGREPRVIATGTPFGSAPTLDGAHLLLYPFEIDPVTKGFLRRRLPYAWRFDIADGACERITVGVGGQCARTRTRDPWTVRSYPFAGYLTFTHRDGPVLALACPSPIGIAWAGDSLVVTTWDADVLLFRDLWNRLMDLTN
jgi:hypothetical protein